MPKACVKQKMKPKSEGGQGMSRKAAVDACYPKAGKMTKAGLRMGLIKMKEKPTKKTTKRRKGGKLGRDY